MSYIPIVQLSYLLLSVMVGATLSIIPKSALLMAVTVFSKVVIACIEVGIHSYHMT